MRNSRNFSSAKRKYVYASIMIVLVFIACMAFRTGAGDDFDIARREVLLRKIGHELLLRSGDSTSRVLPVQKISENEYRVGFEKAFSFETDSLVHITRQLLATDPLAGDYIVTVLHCSDASTAYGFAVSGNAKNDIVTCLGRKQPKACYTVNIKFRPAGMNTATGYILGALPFLAFAGFIFFRPKPKKTPPYEDHAEIFTLGGTVFNAQERQLVHNEETTDLTATETRLLLIFALSPNETIERSRLQKEIWEDEGVIVGRSLDMFISKLRKKLEPDPDTNIVVVRGKGYKLEVGGVVR